MLGIGGGGDVVGALAVGAPLRGSSGRRSCSAASPGSACRSTRSPGPRRSSEIDGGDAARRARGARRAADGDRRRRAVLRVAPGRATSATPTVLIDVTAGAAGRRRGHRRRRRRRSAATCVIYVDVGGDAIAAGDEPGLGSPLCDAVMLAAGDRASATGSTASARSSAPAATASSTPAEVLARIAALAARRRLDRHLERRRRAAPTSSSGRGRPAAPRRACRSSAARAASSARPRSAAAGAACRWARSARSPSLRPRGGGRRAAAGARRSRTPTSSRPPARRSQRSASRTELDYERDRAAESRRAERLEPAHRRRALATVAAGARGCGKLSRRATAAVRALALPVRRRRRADAGRLRRQRRRRLPQHPAARARARASTRPRSPPSSPPAPARRTTPTSSQMYEDLVYATPGLKESQLGNFFKDATFGVEPGNVERTYSPRDDVTIVRDQFGVPRIYGADRAGAMFGAGYVAAEDRLFFIDALRHAGRAELASFAGGAKATGMDARVWADTPVPRRRELQVQFDLADEVYGAGGRPDPQDVDQLRRRDQPPDRRDPRQPAADAGRVPALGHPAGPGGLEGHRRDLDRLAGRRDLRQGRRQRGQLGARARGGAEALRQARRASASGPTSAAPTTPRRRPRSTARASRTCRSRSTPKAALPDPGTVVEPDGGRRVARARGRDVGSRRESALPDIGAAAPRPARLDAAALERAAGLRGASRRAGAPSPSSGPQVSYFTPQILMEQEIHAPGGPTGPPLDARGAAFPGTNLYVQLGHGRDYAWSATSAGQDIIDTFAVTLCNPDGSKPTIDSMGYRFRGALPADRRARAGQRLDPVGRRHDPVGLGDLPRRAHRARDRHPPGRDQRQAVRVHEAARDLLPRGRLGARVRRLQQPARRWSRRRSS